MELCFLDERLWFPEAQCAEEDGLLAFGGDLRPERLILAYRSGIFPWYTPEEPILWWCPDPRFVLYTHELKVQKSMRSILRSGQFTFKLNTAFREVLAHCRHIQRKDQPGTWITDEIEIAYNQMHELGYAISAETWLGDELVGGLYGIKLGNMFFGESMFANVSNASKYAFINCVEWLKTQDVPLIDCQIYTEHLESFGARMISREDFLSHLKQHIP